MRGSSSTWTTGQPVLTRLRNTIATVIGAMLHRSISKRVGSAELLIKSVQRYIKRQVEREIFLPVLIYADKSPELAKVRLNWGTPETQELVPADLIQGSAAATY